MSKLKLNLIEVILILVIGIATIITQPPIPLLAIPFITIISMRSIFALLEDSPKGRKMTK